MASETEAGGGQTQPAGGEIIPNDVDRSRLAIGETVVTDLSETITAAPEGEPSEPDPSTRAADQQETDRTASGILRWVDRHRHQSRGRVYAVVGVAALIAALVIGWRTINTAEPAMAISGVSVTVAPSSGVGHCPRAVFTFTASIQTNGASGRIAFRWRNPDGSLSSVRDVDALSTGAVREILQFTYVESNSAQGYAQLLVLTPERLSSPAVEVSYLCP